MTYKLTFPAACCPSTYTRVKSDRSSTGRTAREPAKKSERRERVRRAKQILEQKSTGEGAQRRRDAWMDGALGGDDDGYFAEGEGEPSEAREPQSVMPRHDGRLTELIELCADVFGMVDL